MTDEQIIKDLECCIGNIQCGKCSIFGTINCMNNLMQDALDLINRQKAENERLKCEMGKLLPKDCSYAMQMEVSNKLESQIKSEAIKSFAERLKRKRIALKSEEPVYDLFKVGAIDNLVKEMTEVETN